MAALLQQVGALDCLLGAAELDVCLAAQFDAACLAIKGCSEISERLQLECSDVFRLGSSLSLVFRAGLRFLHQPAWLDDTRTQLLTLQHVNCQLTAANAVLHRLADPNWQPEAAAAFVRTAGRPQAVLPWLLALSQVLLDVGELEPRQFMPCKGMAMWHASWQTESGTGAVALRPCR